MTQIGRMAGSI